MPNTMKKFCFLLAVTALLLSGGTIGMATAATKNTEAKPASSAATKADLQDIAAIKASLQDLMDASNRHDIEAVLKHYSPNFMSGDGLSLKEVRGLIQDTWRMFPDIRYSSQILEVRVSGNWATVESLDSATATAKVDPVVSDKPGTMKSRSKGLLYLHRIGKTWEIASDYTLYEKATITYGPFDNISLDVDAPEQVFAGEAYTAKVRVGIPAGNIAFATLSQEPLVYPQRMGKDKFRTLSTDKTELERIFNANTTNNNEVVTATVGFTEIGQDEQERPTIQLKGIMTIVKRVNVVPKSTYKDVKPGEHVIRSSADGKIRLNAAENSEDEEDDTPDSGTQGVPQD